MANDPMGAEEANYRKRDPADLARDSQVGRSSSDSAHQKRRQRLAAVLFPLALVLLWQLAAQLGWIDRRFFPPPSAILVTLYHMAWTATFWHDIGISLFRVLAGFILGAVPGVFIGLVMGLMPMVRAALEPVVSALYPVPKLALLPLFIIIFGVGETFKVVTIATGCVLLIALNTMTGVLSIDDIYLDVARNYGASRKDYYLTVAIPGALPFIFAGLRLGMGVALLLIVAAEYVGAQSGIGYLVWSSYEVFDINQMYVGLILMSFFGWFSFSLLNWLEHVFVPWQD